MSVFIGSTGDDRSDVHFTVFKPFRTWGGIILYLFLNNADLYCRPSVPKATTIMDAHFDPDLSNNNNNNNSSRTLDTPDTLYYALESAIDLEESNSIGGPFNPTFIELLLQNRFQLKQLPTVEIRHKFFFLFQRKIIRVVERYQELLQQ